MAYEPLETRCMLSVAPGLTDTPQTFSGTLNGKIVFTSGGHGWQWNDTLGRYATDRGDNNEIVEDFGNQEQMSFFADYALRAGATVVTMRPVGRQINEVVLDNDSADVTFTGTWSNSSSTRYYDEDYGASADAVPYRFASTVTGAATSTATYTPNIPQAGFYPVYTWVLRGTDRAVQTYRVNHTGGSTEISVDHSKVGSGWIYLGTYHFNAGKSTSGEGSVVITNKAAATGDVVIADAIRFGNGMGDWVDTPTGAPGISGYPREDENSFHWIARSVGVGTTLSTATGASSNNNVSAPSNFAQYMFAGTFGEAVYIGFHSNAGGGRGARGLIDSSAPTPHQAGTNGLADILGDQINQDMQNLNGVFEYNWTTGTTSTFTSGFGEINLGSGAEMDATIIETAFHDSVEDAAIMRDPKGRDQIARSTYQGTLQYFSLYGSPLATNTSLPTPPTSVRAISNASGQVTINWAAGPTSPSSVYGAAATGFKIYASIDGYGFDGGTAVGNVTTTTLSGYDPNTPYYFKVAATNAGGESGASEVVTALPSGGAKQVLIVNGFDRYDRTQNFRYAYAHTGDGLVDRVWPRWNNSFDYINRVENAIQAAKPGTHVASTSNEAVISGAVNLTDYKVVVWILGNESTVNDTFNATEQTKVTQFLAAGGNLFLSGAEIAWDLDQQNNGRTFYENTLKGNYVSDDAGIYTATVVTSPGIFSGLSNFAFSSGASSTIYSTRDDQVYDVVTPDVISAQAGAANALTYSTNAAGIQAGTGGIGTGSIVMFGFPFETMTNETRRQQAMGRILDFLGAGYTIDTRVNGQDADSPTGPILVAGGNVTLTYVLANTGIIGLSGITIVDDNGTPGTAGDDFSPSLTSGDTNSNNILDVGETWTYTATRTVVAGQRTHSGKATVVTGAQTIIKTDPGNFFGSAPGINIETFVDGQDADSPTGPTLFAGSATFTYVLTNTGNIALNTVAVVDDNSTPGNTADDFNPSFDGSDTNSNNLLDLGETWTYSAMRSVMAGQFSNTATASGKDSINQVVNDNDPTNYFGLVPGIEIETFVNGQDADSPTGPVLAVGGNANFTYVMTNTGSMALNTVVVVDDNGTPGNTADDFNPAFDGGDTNSNNVLDLGETWTYSATRSVGAGQFSNIGTASGTDSLSQSANDTDPGNFFGSVPGINIETFVNGQDADSPTGPTIAYGTNATLTYSLTNTGNIALSNVVVVDDNGTPGNTADDFNPSFDGGDTNSNNLLDLGETWSYSASPPAVVGQYTGQGSVSAQDSISQVVNDADPASYFGSAPGINIETFVNGQDADSPTGPTLLAGTTAFTYVLTNTGNVALNTVVVVDNNGTPGNTADDFNPSFDGGDTNSNNLLDLGETWSYSATRSVVAGQFSNIATASGKDSINQVVNDTDPTNYFGAVAAIDIKTRVNGLDADSPTGPVLVVGSNANFTYVLTNTGSTALNTVVVVDDNGTPGNTADDFNPAFDGGDTNSNNVLDLGETWTYSATRSVGAGQFSNIGTASGTDSLSQSANDTDPGNFFGSVPGINIETFVNGQDADSPTGPTVGYGSNVLLTYTLTNTGNIALNTVIVVDDNGTPGNTGDDFNAIFSGGDTNSNNLLDLGEIWSYSTTRAAVFGQYTGSGSVSAQDSINQIVSDADATNYIGAANADFNHNDEVDAADFVLWRKNDGVVSGATQSQGDANGDTAVASTDYDVWRSQFGDPPPGSGAGGGGEAMTLSSSDGTSATAAAFSALGTIESEPQRLDRNLAKTHRPFVARIDRDQWAELLADLIEGRSRHRSVGDDGTAEADGEQPCGEAAANGLSLSERLLQKQMHRAI